MSLVIVVLPEPLLPTTPNKQPAGMAKETLSSAKRAVRAVAEGDPVEFDAALQMRPYTSPAARLLRPLVHDLAEHAHGERDFLIFVHHGDDLYQWSRDPA